MRSILARLSLLALVACGRELPAPVPSAESAAPTRGGILELATYADMRAIDPANVVDGLAPQVVAAMFAGLVDFDGAGKVVPDLAESWTVDDDGTTFRFTLRPGVRFHDGDEVTAEDVKRSAERALHPSSPNPYASYLSSLVGFEAFSAKKADALEGITVQGRYVVAFHLRAPDATFLPLLAMLPLRPVCKSGGSRYSDTWRACGAGPFKLMEGGWVRGTSLLLVRHDGYFRPGLPYLDGVRWTFHQNQTTQTFKFVRGELDVFRDFLSVDLMKFQADPRWQPFGEYEPEKQIIGEAMNVEVPPFDNVEIRRAVAAALDREAIRKIRAGSLRVANQLVPAAVFGHEPSLAGQSFDLARALEHMRKAGYPYDPVTQTGGWPHPVPYVAYKAGLQEFMGQVVQQQLARIGIRLELRIVNYPTFMALRGRRRASAMGPGLWTEDFPDALSFLEPLFHSSSIAEEDSNNWSFYANPRFDDLVTRAKRELDDGRRKKLYDAAQTILVDEAPWAFSQSFRFYIQRQPYVRDFHSHPMWSADMKATFLDRVRSPLFTEHGVRALLGASR